jgi:predicted CoA-binding protein
MKQYDSSEIIDILKIFKSIAVVGLSANSWRPSNQVASYLIYAGYKIYPVNPNHEEILGLRCYPDLKSVPAKIDIVNIFRRPEYVLPIVEEAIEIGVKTIWMQLGVINHNAAQKAKSCGLKVIMNRCIRIEHRRFIK